MGCACSRDSTKIIINRRPLANKQFILKIYLPEHIQPKVLFYNSEIDKEPITDLMNSFLFTSAIDDDLDANFISIYNKYTDSFDYYIQRIGGYEIENEEEPNKGKMWNCYIIKEKIDWTYVCHNNRVISMNDEVELRYEEGPKDKLQFTNC